MIRGVPHGATEVTDHGRPGSPGPNRLAFLVEPALMVVSILVALAVFQAVREHLPTTLNVSTDLIGYSTFYSFDGEQYLETFYTGVLLAPLVAIAVFILLTVAVRSLGVRPPARGALLPRSRNAGPATSDAPPPESATVPASDFGSRVSALARVLIVGGACGFELGIRRGSSGAPFWWSLAGGSLAYAAVVGGVAVIAGWRSRAAHATWRTLAFANAAGGCLPILGLAAVSDVTTLTTQSDKVIHSYPWMPLWVAAAATVLLVGLLARQARARGLTMQTGRSLERRTVFLVALPVVLFLAVARLPSELPPIDTFENGQQLATIRMLQAGLVPWRDFFGAHGLLEDTLRLLPGNWIFGDTWWGMQTGFEMIVRPLEFIALYLFAYRLAGLATALPLTVACYFFHLNAVIPFTRFMFWPLVLIWLLRCLERRSRTSACGIGLALVVYNIVAPEAGICVGALALAFLCHDAYFAVWTRRTILQSFGLTLAYVTGLVGASIVAVAALASIGALHGFILYYQTNLPGRSLAGALPLHEMVPPYRTWVLAPAVAVVLAVGILAVKTRVRTVLGSPDFAMIAAAAVTVVYYQKFTERPDLHILHVYGASLPLFILVAYQLILHLEAALGFLQRRWRLTVPCRFPVAALVLAVTVVTTRGALYGSSVDVADRYRATAASEPWWPGLGYQTREDQALDEDMRSVLDAYTAPNEQIFDFTNEAGLLYYIEGRLPSTRFYIVNMAFARSAQVEAVAELRQARPRYVLYYGRATGSLAVMDTISNAVRHYEISQYILDNYRPLLEVDDQVLYVADDATGIPDPAPLAEHVHGRLRVSHLDFESFECNWGYAPAYLSIPHPPASQATSVRAQRTAGGQTIAPPAGHEWADYHWVRVMPNSGRFVDDTVNLLMTQPVGTLPYVTFRTLAGSSRDMVFPIGACPQWHGYGSSPLSLVDTTAQQITIELLP